MILLIAFYLFLICSSYKIGVVEFYPKTLPKPNTAYSRAEAQGMMYDNLLFFEPIIQNASLQKVQIIVFPEDCLYGATFERYYFFIKDALSCFVMFTQISIILPL
jgi:hypothetical protein